MSEFLPDDVIREYRVRAAQFRQEQEDRLPKAMLGSEHMGRCQLLPNRDALLSVMPKNGVVAELGVDHGDFSQKILAQCTPKTLHLVDSWACERYNDSLYQAVLKRFAPEIGNGQVAIHRALSVAAASQFDDASLDWIYIDTDHSYKTTRAELAAYAAKIRPGGLIAGHDYALCNFVKWYRYGVIEAVHEFCLKEGWELVCLTLDHVEKQSFAVRKLA